MTEIQISDLILTPEGYTITSETQLLAGNVYYLYYDVPVPSGSTEIKDYTPSKNAVSITDNWGLTIPLDRETICFTLKEPSLTEIPLIKTITNNNGYIIYPSAFLTATLTYTLEYNRTIINRIFKTYISTNDSYFITDALDISISEGTSICFTLSDALCTELRYIMTIE